MSRLQRAGYQGLDWLGALNAQQPQKEASLSEEEVAKDVVQRSMEAAFKHPAKKEDPNQSVRRAAEELVSLQQSTEAKAHCETIKNKLSSRAIDPVALGVVTKEEWEASVNPSWVEEKAKVAALEFEKKAAKAWQERALTAKAPVAKPNPETAQAGRIMPSMAANEEVRGQASRVPLNANSILDPNRLSELFTQPTAHDQMVEARLKERKEREAVKKAELAPKDLGPNPMKGGKVVSSGAKDEAAFVQRVPSNQVSMLDIQGNEQLSREEMSGKLSELFKGKVQDNGEAIREANKQRREEIRGNREQKDKSWDSSQNLKPQSTADLQNRLMQIWLPTDGK